MSTDPIVYEYKIKRALSWEQADVWTRQHFPPDDSTSPCALAQQIANAQGAEVRWNSQGSLQGHYVHPTAE